VKSLIRVLFILAVLSSQVNAQDYMAIDSLKVVHNSLIKALDSGNLDAILRIVHPEAIAFRRDSSTVSRFGPDNPVKEMASELLTQLAGIVSVTYDKDFRVYGKTGIVCERSVMQPGGKSKKEMNPSRTTFIYSQQKGRWYLVSWHNSATPLR